MLSGKDVYDLRIDSGIEATATPPCDESLH